MNSRIGKPLIVWQGHSQRKCSFSREAMSVVKTYKNVVTIFRTYWAAYGGIKQLLESPYLHCSALLTLIMATTWRTEGWWADPIAILPNIIGFTVAAYAVVVAFGDEKFRRLLTRSDDLADDQHSPFMGLNSALVHAVIVQVLSLLSAVLAKSRPMTYLLSLCSEPIRKEIIGSMPWLSAARVAIGNVGWFCGYLIFIYGLVLTIAAAMSIFRLANWYDQYYPTDESPPSQKQ